MTDTLAAFLLLLADTHWFMAWCVLWLGWVPVFVAIVIAEFIGNIVRMAVIASRGWPPGSLEGDGDSSKESSL